MEELDDPPLESALSEVAASDNAMQAMFFLRFPLSLEGTPLFSSMVTMDIDGVIVSSRTMFFVEMRERVLEHSFFLLAPDLTERRFSDDVVACCEILAAPKLLHKPANSKKVSIAVANINGVPLYLMLHFGQCSASERVSTCEKLKAFFKARYLFMLRDYVGNELKVLGHFEEGKNEPIVDGYITIRPAKQNSKIWIRGM